MELLTNLGIDWRLFIAQAINFVILLVLLQRFLYKPLIAMLDKREARLKQGLLLSDQMEARAAKMEEERLHVIRDARSEAERIISAAVADAETARAEVLETSRLESKRIVEEGKAILLERERLMLDSARKEVATLVVDSTRKVLGELGATGFDVDRINQAVKKVGKA